MNETKRGLRNTFLLSLSVLLCLLCLLFFSTTQATAASVVARGKCGAQGSNLMWTLDRSGTVVISGTGEMKNFGEGGGPWRVWSNEGMDEVLTDYNEVWDISEAIKRVEIQEGVTSIGNNAFVEMDELNAVSLPSSLMRIGRYAFSYCQKMNGISIPSGVQTIEKYAFEGCKMIQGLTIPSSIKTISVGLFSDCRLLNNITIPSGVQSIGSYAFSSCTSLESIVVPGGVTKIDEYTFSDCTNLKSVKLPNGVLSIGQSAFCKCVNLKLFDFPKKLKRIENNAFQGTGLETIEIPNGVKTLDWYEFGECKSLKKIVIPESMEEIDSDAFFDSDNVEEVRVLSKMCKISSLCFPKTAVIYGYRGSSAEDYAKENNNKFVALDAAHKHSYGKTTVVRATLSNDGVSKKVCSCCKKTVQTVIPRIKTVKLSKTEFSFSGKAISPAVAVKDRKGNALMKDRDYALTYAKGRKNFGVYAVKVTFKGNYVGSKKVMFKIVPGKVTGLKQLSQKGINFEWNPVAYADYYEIYFYEGTTGKHQFLGKTSKLTFGNSTITKNTTMRFKVRAVARDKGDQLYYGAFSKELVAVAK